MQPPGARAGTVPVSQVKAVAMRGDSRGAVGVMRGGGRFAWAEVRDSIRLQLKNVCIQMCSLYKCAHTYVQFKNVRIHTRSLQMCAYIR